MKLQQIIDEICESRSTESGAYRRADMARTLDVHPMTIARIYSGEMVTDRIVALMAEKYPDFRDRIIVAFASEKLEAIFGESDVIVARQHQKRKTPVSR